MKNGIVYLVGAGAGNKGLMTLRGAECLSMADVVVYDKLAGNFFLSMVKEDVELIFAGKESGNHYLTQSQTNALLVEKAREGKNVVRLKGGDPFVFGRGGEEAEYLRENGIDFEIVSGVSSSYSAPAFAGIPVTHRETASSLHIITGHEKADSSETSIDYSVLAKEKGTLVFLMSLKNLPNITSQLIKYGKSANTPVAVVQEGTTARQRCVVGTLDTICDIVENEGITTPALTVIGDSVLFKEKLEWFNKKTLSGVRVLSTATKEISKDLANQIELLGGECVEISLIKVLPIKFENDFSFDEYNWIIFSSQVGVNLFFQELINKNIDIRTLHGVKFGAVGKKTQQALMEKGIFCDCVPNEYHSNALADELKSKLKPSDRILLLRAETASNVLPKLFEEYNIFYKDIPLYRVETDSSRKNELNRLIGDMDYIVFESGSAVKAYTELIDFDVSAKMISIGPVTTKIAEDLGVKITETAEIYNNDGIVETILKQQKIGDSHVKKITPNKTK